MRKIFFRGKVTDRYAKYHPLLVAGDWVDGGINTDSCPVCIISDSGTESVPVEPETIGEYAGASDVKGKPICEHDIVEFRAYNPFASRVMNFRGVVVFRNCAFWVLASPTFEAGESYTLAELFNGKDSGVTVIGNVWDNSELLPEYTPELLEET